MARLHMFAVWDEAAQAYLSPFFMTSQGLGERAFCETCVDPQSKFARYAKDFTLFHLGHYDEASAKIVQHAAPIAIINALQAQARMKDYGVAEPDVPAVVEPRRGHGNGLAHGMSGGVSSQPEV